MKRCRDNIMSMPVFIVVSMLLNGMQPAYANEIPHLHFNNFTYEDGLSSNTTYQVVQDNVGFIWIATSSGLNRFDGSSFEQISTTKELAKLSREHIRCLYFDDKGFLWIGTLDGGLYQFDNQTGKTFHYLSEENNSKSLSNNEILCIYKDSYDILWVGTENGLNAFDYQTKTFHRFLHNPEDSSSLSFHAVLTIKEDRWKRLWIGTWAGGLNLLIANKSDENWQNKASFRHFKSGYNGLNNNHIWSIFEDSKGRMWIGTHSGGLCYVDGVNDGVSASDLIPSFYPITQKMEGEFSLISNEVQSINEDENGWLWVGTSKGLSILDLAQLDGKDLGQEENRNAIKFESFQHSDLLSGSLAGNHIKEVYIDQSGSVWLSIRGGVSIFNNTSLKFRTEFGEDIKSTPDRINAIYTNKKDEIWLGTESSGVIIYNPEKAQYRYFFQGKEDVRDNKVFDIFSDHEGKIWISKPNEVLTWDPLIGELHKFPISLPENSPNSSLKIFKIFEDSKNRMWLVTSDGLVKLNSQTMSYQFYQNDPNNKNSLSYDIIYDIVEDDLGNFWIATYGGLQKIKFEQDDKMTFELFTYEYGDSNSLCNNRVHCLAYENNQLWIGTENGISLYNIVEKKFRNFSREEGLLNPFILSLLFDDNGNLWGSTQKGIFKYEVKENYFRHFDFRDGLHNSEFITRTRFKDASGKLYFGRGGGYNGFYPEEIQPNWDPPRIVITGLSIFDKDWKIGRGYFRDDEIMLNHNQNFFTIEFAALDYIRPSENRFAYKLENVDKDWVYCGNRNFASYTNLDIGKYKFKVKGANSDGLWNETGATLIITILPPFWKTLWFQALVIIIGSIIIFTIFKVRQHQIQSREKILTRQVKLRTHEVEYQKLKVERLLEELRSKNDDLEEKVQERTLELEQNNEELRRSNKDLEQFAYIASHDLQEPLRMVGNFVQLLERRYSTKVDKEGREFIQFAVEGVKRMSSLIRNLLSYSRVGRQYINFNEVDLCFIVEQKIQDLQQYIAKRNAKVIIQALPGPIFCDPNQIGVVFFNLISNALKFNKSIVPEIHIRMENTNDSHFLFAVEDNGIGIDPVYQDKVFEIFKRLNYREEFEGNGIGLALCKRIIINHGGEIWFESNEKSGTTFFFSISKNLKRNKTDTNPKRTFSIQKRN